MKIPYSIRLLLLKFSEIWTWLWRTKRQKETLALLHYAEAEHSLQLEKEDFALLHKAILSAGFHSWSISDDAKLSIIYSRLSDQLNKSGKSYGIDTVLKSRGPTASRKQMVWGITTILCVFIFLIIQAYYVTGAAILDSKSKYDKESVILSKQVTEIQLKIDSTQSQSKNLLISQKTDLTNSLDKITKEITSHAAALHTWNQCWSIPYDKLLKYFTLGSSDGDATVNSPPSKLTSQATVPDKKDETKLNQQVLKQLEEEKRAGTVLMLIKSFIAPLLSGLLGSLFYILRSLTKIRNYPELLFENIALRVVLGAFAGVVIVLLLPVDDSISNIKQLTPLALAFTVGYCVDVIYGLLDRIVFAFKP